jgi:hypothetical protein
MKTLYRIFQTIGFLCYIGLFVFMFWLLITWQPPNDEDVLVIEAIIWIQEEVGARPDGVIGPETTTLANAQSKKDLPEYCNRCAVRSMRMMAGE